MNHQAFCEVPHCSAQFHPRFGCHKHPYSFAYNLEAQAGFFNRDLSDLVDSFDYMLPRDKKTGSAEEKLAIVRKRFDEDMVLSLEPRGLPEKKPSAKEAKSRKWAGKIRRGGTKPRGARE